MPLIIAWGWRVALFAVLAFSFGVFTADLIHEGNGPANILWRAWGAPNVGLVHFVVGYIYSAERYMPMILIPLTFGLLCWLFRPHYRRRS